MIETKKENAKKNSFNKHKNWREEAEEKKIEKNATHKTLIDVF